MAAGYSEQLREWLPDATDLTLVARHEGRDAASVNAFIDAAKGRAKTLTFVETENGGSICGGYLDVAWVEGGYASDSRRRRFIFTLKNHLGVLPVQFAQRRDAQTAYMNRDEYLHFGFGEGFIVWRGDFELNSGYTYEASGHGATLFHGDRGGQFRASRWELWETN
jgi:hypothetical protein